MKVIIVGAHGEAKELINRVSSGWSISVIDLDQEKLRNFTTNRQIDKIQGDATSSLVLKKAGLDAVSYTHLRAHETSPDLVCRLLLEYCLLYTSDAADE